MSTKSKSSAAGARFATTIDSAQKVKQNRTFLQKIIPTMLDTAISEGQIVAIMIEICIQWLSFNVRNPFSETEIEECDELKSNISDTSTQSIDKISS